MSDCRLTAEKEVNMDGETEYEREKREEEEARLEAIEEEAVSKAKYEVGNVIMALARTYASKITGSGYGDFKLNNERERKVYRQSLYHGFFRLIAEEEHRVDALLVMGAVENLGEPA
jgi:hypothetical protein